MALTDNLSKLAARAKDAQDRAAASRTRDRAALEQDVAAARASAETQAEQLQQAVEAGKGKLSVWWHDLQRSWNELVAKIREDMESKRAEHDVDKAERRAESAEEDAEFATDYAYAAIEEADYAVLHAILARKEADELSAQTTKASA